VKNKLKIVVLMDASRAYDRDLSMGISNFNKLHDKFVFFFISPKYIGQNNLHQLQKRIIAWKPDGIFTRELKGFKSLLKLNVPVIIFPHTKLYKDLVNVWGDNYGVGEMAANYLITKGFRNFAFLGFKDFQWSQERQDGYETTLAKSGFTVNSYVYNDLGLLWEDLPENLLKWLATLQKPCAIFSATDELNIHLLEAVKSLEAKVPDDFSILGVDNDIMLCEMASPALSSIDHNARQAGFLAAQALYRWMEFGERPSADIIVSPNTVITRNSTTLAVEDEQVRAALYYITNTASANDISVDDVVKATILSRRILEKRFRLCIGSTILEEIKKVRIDRIKFLLTNSNLTLQQIAFELNFKSFENITRYFKQYTGVGPLEYRSKNKEL
jgi:LacI family transcriptional regulator